MGIILLTILIVHWLADFVFQGDDIAKTKATNFSSLVFHALTYTAIWFFPVSFLFLKYGVSASIFWFIPITFVSHGIIDYYTSKANKYLFDSGNTHGFFVSVGFDQMLHYIQLYLTLIFLL